MLKYINESTNTQEEYGYACARVRELEKSLLSQELLDKLVESTNLENAIKILAESNIDEYIFNKSISIVALDKALENILKNTINLIDEIAPYPYLFQLFNWKYDFHNLKVLLKAKILAKKEIFPIYEIGNISQDILKSAVFEGKYQSVPIKIERFIKQSEEEYMKSEDIQLIENLLDRGYYEILFNQLEDINQPFLFYYYKTEVDLLNIMIACRSKIRDIKKSKLSEILIKYGSFSPQKFINIYDNSVHSWPNYFNKSDYASVLENGIKYWQEEKSLIELERLVDNFLLNLLKIGKYNTFGLESVIAYYYAKENDIKNIRIIINSKRNLLPKEIIRKIIRDTYV
ncbi:MAG: V-type ATPase subunit [Atribacterota bacterium]